MQLKVEKVDPQVVSRMQLTYLATLTHPQDAYWQEGLIAAADHMEIRIEGRRAGYFVLDLENCMMQFHLEDEFQQEASDIFRRVLDAHSIRAALAATLEPFYFSLCLDHQAGAEVHTYLFSDHRPPQPASTEFSDYLFRKATDRDLLKVLPLFGAGDEFIDLETVEAHFGGQLGYAKMVIGEGILHVLEKEDAIVGTGELRQRAGWVPYADVGMIVHENHRRRGIGTHILTLLKQKAIQRGLKPICSCEAANLGSQKAIHRAGFMARHRVVRFSF